MEEIISLLIFRVDETIWMHLFTGATKQYALMILIEFAAIRSVNFYDQTRVD